MPDWKKQIGSRLAGLNLDPHREAEIVEELCQHLEDRYRELLAAGAGAASAYREAVSELEGHELLRRQLGRVERSMTGEPLVLGGPKRNMAGDLIQDVRYGLRLLRKSPGFTAVATISLALGIGANTAIFTLLNAVLLKSLPVPNPEALVLFSDRSNEGTSTGDMPADEWRRLSYPVYEYIRDRCDEFESLSAFRSGESPISVFKAGEEAAYQASAHLVGGDYFKVLGVTPMLGRVLTADDDRQTAEPAAVISYRYWMDRCAGDKSIAGQKLTLNGIGVTIAGVMPPEFFGVRVRRPPDFWIPLAFQAQIEMRDSFLADNKVFWLAAIGRLRAGSRIEQANASVNVALHQFLDSIAGAQKTPESGARPGNAYIALEPGGRGISGLRNFYAEPLRMLMGIVVLVLAIACANVGNLLLSRSSARQMEVMLRLSLGASRGRLIRQFVTESMLLAGMGGVLGLLFAQWAVSALVQIVSRSSPIDVKPDLLILGFTAAVSVLAGIFFGLAPALNASRTELATGLKERSSRVGGGRVRFGLASGLVVSQVALSLILLVGAGLFGRSLLKLENENLGFNRNNLLLVGIKTRLAGYKPVQLSALYRQLLDRIDALPEVESATVATYSPMGGSSRLSTIVVQGYAAGDGEDMDVNELLIGPDYAEAMGVPLLAGRPINITDTPASGKVAVVNQSFAEHFFHGQNPIGRKFGFDDEKQADIEIVGVIGDVRFDRAREAPTRRVFRPILQVQDEGAYSSELAIRTAGDPQSITAAVREAIAQVDARLPITDVTPIEQQFVASLRQERLVAQLVSFFGLLALVLASVGLYGVMAQAVARRTGEIGIRMALGAAQGKILWMVLRETLLLVVVGIAIGVPAALASGRLISTQLYGLDASDPVTLVIATVILTLIAALAGYLPARRASRVDPTEALRYE